MPLDSRGAACQAACDQAGDREPEATSEAGGESPLAPRGGDLAGRGTGVVTLTNRELGGIDLLRQPLVRRGPARIHPWRSAGWLRRYRV